MKPLQIKWGPKLDLDELPTARTVRDVYGYVDIGTHRVAHHDPWGNERFPWRVYGPPDIEGFREILDEFAQYKEAVALTRKLQRGAVAEP